MSIIDNFINQYKREYDFYKQLARHANDVLESEIVNRGIRAIVSNRAKRADRLKEKLENRNRTTRYKSKRAIEKDIIDLAGLRVALYFPSERVMLDQVVTDLFEVVETKEFPENVHKPKHKKRFSGYWATHYRVKLKISDDMDRRFIDTTFEIQVASVLMHAWSEVEHDLVYKPSSGQLSNEELSILDEINGLVIVGEIALERLQKAIMERTKNQTDITDKYELTSLLFSKFIKHVTIPKICTIDN
jgi:ppGpp synthetase/RelA/SpoT-type nucleotidyltranferase